jgi:hypothetical protein
VCACRAGGGAVVVVVCVVTAWSCTLCGRKVHVLCLVKQLP